MLTLRFTIEDLLRVRFAPEPAPLIESGLALAVLHAGSHEPSLAHWRGRTMTGLSTRSGSAVGRVAELLRPDGLGPTFLDPPIADLSEALDKVSTVSRQQTTAELERLWQGRSRPDGAWRAAVEHHEAPAWRELVASLAECWRALLEAWWPRLREGYAGDVAWRGRVQQEQGLRAMLAGLVPGAAWSGADLRLPGPRTATVEVGGAGLTLMPSLLWRGVPLRSRHPDGSLLLVYSALTPLPLLPEPDRGADPLAGLLGATRARALHVLADPHTTTGLARTLGVSAGSASAHAKTLRAAGLVATVREGKEVRHTCTQLGRLLLAGGTP